MHKFKYAGPPPILQSFPSSSASTSASSDAIESKISSFLDKTKRRAYYPAGTMKLSTDQSSASRIDYSHPAWEDLCDYLSIGRKRRRLWHEEDWEMAYAIDWDVRPVAGVEPTSMLDANVSTSVLPSSQSFERSYNLLPMTPTTPPKLPLNAALTPSLVERKLRKAYNAPLSQDSPSKSTPHANTTPSNVKPHSSPLTPLATPESTPKKPSSQFSRAYPGRNPAPAAIRKDSVKIGPPSAKKKKYTVVKLDTTSSNIAVPSLPPAKDSFNVRHEKSNKEFISLYSTLPPPPPPSIRKNRIKPISQIESSVFSSPSYPKSPGSPLDLPSFNIDDIQGQSTPRSQVADYYESNSSSISSLPTQPNQPDLEEDEYFFPQHQVESAQQYGAFPTSSSISSPSASRRSSSQSPAEGNTESFPISPTHQTTQHVHSLSDAQTTPLMSSLSSLIRRGEGHQPPHFFRAPCSLPSSSEQNDDGNPENDTNDKEKDEGIAESSQRVATPSNPTTPVRNLKTLMALVPSTSKHRKSKEKLKFLTVGTTPRQSPSTGSPAGEESLTRKRKQKDIFVFSQNPEFESTPYATRNMPVVPSSQPQDSQSQSSSQIQDDLTPRKIYRRSSSPWRGFGELADEQLSSSPVAPGSSQQILRQASKPSQHLNDAGNVASSSSPLGAQERPEQLPATQDVLNDAAFDSQEMPVMLEDAFSKVRELVTGELDGWTVAIDR